MKKAKKGGASGGNWMDTYGDMVTLLLCFFVLLYAISSVDQEKFKNLVASLNPDSVQEEMELGEGTGMEEEPPEVSASEDVMQELSERLTEALMEMNLQDEVQVIAGEDYNFIVFNGRVFFDGDSYILREEGKEVIDTFCETITPFVPEIYEVQIFGHTSQATPEYENRDMTDRMLSAERGAQVAAFIQYHEIISPGRIVSMGFGQHRPIASFDTPEDRSRNRRVEILITKNDRIQKTLTEYYEEVYGEEVANMQPDRIDSSTKTQ